MKKLLAIVLAMVMILAAVACGSQPAATVNATASRIVETIKQFLQFITLILPVMIKSSTLKIIRVDLLAHRGDRRIFHDGSSKQGYLRGISGFP